MFREMRKKKAKGLSDPECLQLLREQPRGVLSLQGDDGYPYGVPTNFWYCEEDGCIYFHGGKIGHKVDSIARSNKASLCVISEPIAVKDSWAPDYKSVIVFGRIEIMKTDAAAMQIAKALSLQFTRDADYIAREIEKFGPATLFFRMVPEHITGKRVNES